VTNENASERMTRTFLAAPAHRERLVASAARSTADAVFLDLEDAVPTDGKPAALDAAARAIATLDWGAKTVAVRVNAFGSEWFAAEVAKLAALPRLDALILPKAERVADAIEMRRVIAAARPASAPPLEIDCLIETALGLVNVEALAACDAGIGALHLGVGDFAASIGAKSEGIGVSPAGYRHKAFGRGGYATTPLDLFAYPMMRLLVAARAFGRRAIDGPWAGYQDSVLTKAAAEKAAALGFDGKQVIHPSQIDATREAFSPSAGEIEQAKRIVVALRDGASAGRGAITVDGRMIDLADARLAERVLQRAGVSA
jgi:malyl-CoA/(S)-citramalyl-CoA lyase